MVVCVWEVSWRRGQTVILTKVLLTIAALFSHPGWAAQLWVIEDRKPSVCRWLSIRYLVSNWLKPSVRLVILLFNSHLLPLFFRLFTQVHLLIDGSVEGQYVTYPHTYIYVCIQKSFNENILLHPQLFNTFINIFWWKHASLYTLHVFQ